MLISQKHWILGNRHSPKEAQLCRALGVHPILAQLLINRGIEDLTEARTFLNPEVSRLHDPFLLKDMRPAVERIRRAAKAKDKVLIFGDYDVDGVTSSAVLHNAFKKIGIPVVNYIPHRIYDGYGLNEEVIPFAQQHGVRLFVAVDCGITSLREVELLKRKGMDVIIIDHHEPLGGDIPQATAVIDPKRKDCSYPFKDLAAVGLAAKLIQAFSGKMPDDDLDLIALGTVADVVPLKGENRILVKAGLPQISGTKNKGLAALMDVAKLRGKKFRPHTIGFILGPRINASGRMDSAHKSLDLLLCQDVRQARELAEFLEDSNCLRQKLQRVMEQEAADLIEQEINFKEHRVIVLSKQGWHKGVLGIVASRLAETYYRPAVVISLNDGVGTASARSIEGFHLHEALRHCGQILEHFGGHKLAAGLTIREENIGDFKHRINEFAKDMLKIQDLIPGLTIDCELPLSSLNLDLARDLELLEPFGEGNPEPLFCTRQLTVKSHPVVLGRETLKFWVTDGQTTLSAVGFGMAKYRDMVRMGGKVDLAYQVSIDDWNKADTVQLKLKDIKPS